MFAIKYLKPISKYLLGFLVLLILVGGIFIYLQNRTIEVNFDENGAPIVPEKGWYESQVGYMKRVVRWQEELERMQAQDDFGGATPQETFDAFVQALKEGDTEKASRYFVFNDRENELKKLGELTEGQMSDYISFLSGEKNISCNDSLGWCEFSILYQGEDVLAVRVRHIKNSGKWKMESL